MALTTRERVTLFEITRAVAFILSREGTPTWERSHPRNLAVGCQKLCGSDKY